MPHLQTFTRELGLIAEILVDLLAKTLNNKSQQTT